MNRTFGFLMMCLLAVGLLASCNKKENNNGTADGKGFKAITEQNGGGNSKTHGVLHEAGTDHEYLEVQWTQYDQIKVNNGSETSTFETSDANTTMGAFYVSGGMPFDFTSGDFTAIYPATNADGVENTVGNLSATFTLPATQTYSAEHPSSFAEKAMPMMAHSDNQTLYFKNVLGGVCFPMVGDDLHVSKIVLTSSNTADKLWGVFNADYNNGEPTLTYVSGGSNSITLNCDVTLNATATEFTIMVPPGTLGAGFTVAAYDGEIEIYEKSTSTAPGANFIPRNTIRVADQDLNVVISGLTVTTASPVFITTNSAYCAGTVTVSSKDIEPITERGICWALASVTTTPTLNNNYAAENQTTAGTYGITVDGLTKDQVYYVRAYAKNTLGEVTYGTPIPFATRRDYVNDYGGKLCGLFSVANGSQQCFAMGNLQYKAANNTWRYAEYQFEYVGYSLNGATVGNVYANGEHPNPADNGLKSDNGQIEYYRPEQITTAEQVDVSNNAYNTNYQGWIDWFEWGTSGRNHHILHPEYSPALCQPWERVKYYTATPEYDWQNASYAYFHNFYYQYDAFFYAFDDATHPLDGDADWACNTIQNGSASGKYTPSANDFEHILHVRNASTVNGVANARFSYARLQVRRGDVINGIFLFPDSFTWPEEIDHYPSHLNVEPAIETSDWPDVAIFSESEWSLLEKAHVVFLPASGCYGRTGYCEWGNGGGRYWTSTPVTTAPGGAYDFAFSPRHTVEGVVNAYSADYKFYGFSVRFMMP